MLPGVAGICMFMLVLTLINAFAALRGSFGGGRGKDGVLMLCTLLAAGVFGLLRLRRWGWALGLGGGLMLCLGELFVFLRKHVGPFLVQGLFSIGVFFFLWRAGGAG